MPRILGREPFSNEDVAEVASAVVANYFRAAAVGVGDSFDSAGDFVVETGPAAAGVEFIVGVIKRSLTLPAYVNAVGFVIPVFAGKRPFGALVQDDPGFFRSEVVQHFNSFFQKTKQVKEEGGLVRFGSK
jgi:hypothetical protein